MQDQPHLQIFNCLPKGPAQESKFTFFPLLPPEIRLLVWEYSLQKRRIIDITLHRRALEPSAAKSLPYHNGELHSAAVNGYEVLSKLLRVNSESRQVTMLFYRIQIPCVFYDDLDFKESKPGTLYMNPEYDTLRISARSCIGELFF